MKVAGSRVDSARSWAVAAACCWINVFTFAMVRSSAVVYVELLKAYDVSRERASWPVTLSGVCYFLAGPIAGVLARYISIWKLTVVGCMAGSLAVCACFYANNIVYLSVFLGVVHGTGIGLLALCSVVINQHFKRYRASASGISNAGFTVGGLIFPPLVQTLTEKYGIRGTFLICGGLMLNSTAGAFLQRYPPQEDTDVGPASHKHEAAEIVNVIPDKVHVDNCGMDDKNTEDSAYNGVDAPEIVDSEGRRVIMVGDSEGGLPVLRIVKCAERGSTSENLEPANTDKDWHVTALKDSVAPEGKPDQDKEDVPFLEKPPRCPSPCIFKTAKEAESKEDKLLSFLLLPKFYLIAFSLAQLLTNMMTYMTVIIDFAVDRGISEWIAVFLILSYTIADLVARLGSGWITDKGFLARSTMMGFHFFLWGVVEYLIPMHNDYYYQMALSVVCGWCNGCTLILIAVLFMELVGIGKLGVCFGIATFFAGVLGLTRPLLIGHYRDTLGDYEGLFGLLGGLSVSISFLWLCISIRDRCQSRLRRLKRTVVHGSTKSCA